VQNCRRAALPRIEFAGLTVKFDISVQRNNIIGNDIDIRVEAEGDEVIVSVDYILDGFNLDTDNFNDTPLNSLRRTFSQAGDARPGKQHRLIVKVHGKPGSSDKNGSRVWTDLN